MKLKFKSFTAVGIVMGLLVFAGQAFVSPTGAPAQDVKTVTGKLVGHNCFVTGYQCPVAMKDLMASTEKDFVLVTDDEHYFLPNISTHLKVSYVLETVTVKGTVKGNSIVVQEFVWDGKTIWTPEMQRQFEREAYDYP